MTEKQQPESRSDEGMPSAGDIRLALGEMNAAEMRVAVAAVRWMLSRAVRSERGLCHWKPDQDGVYWTTCGNAFTFIDAGPSANKMKFCCYCGGTMSEQRFER